MRLNKEEKEIIEAYEKGVFKPISNVKKQINQYREYAKSTLQKNKRINIRISERDLIHIQMKAIEEGLPYQTLITSILHKYANDKIKEKVEV